MVKIDKDINYIQLLEEGEVAIIRSEYDAFEFMCQIKDNTKYPTRKKILFIVKNLADKGQLKFTNLDYIDILDDVLDILVKK